jgi:glutamine synthetase
MPTDTDLTLSNRDYVMRTVEERGVRFVRLWFVDVLGMLKSIAIPVTELETVLEDGVGLDGSALEGGARLAERDVIARTRPEDVSGPAVAHRRLYSADAVRRAAPGRSTVPR